MYWLMDNWLILMLNFNYIPLPEPPSKSENSFEFITPPSITELRSATLLPSHDQTHNRNFKEQELSNERPYRLEAWYVLQWLKVWWAWRHAIITCPMLQMLYPSLLRQHQSQANAGKSKCEGGGICYFEYFIFFIYDWKVRRQLPFSPVLGCRTRYKNPMVLPFSKRNK